jgi:hypothetical protein
MSTPDHLPCDDTSGSVSSSSSSSSMCIQQSVFKSDFFNISVPNWNSRDKSNTVLLHSNISASASTKYGEDENSQQHLQLAKATFWDSIDRQAPQQCRPLKWNEIPALVDHRALIAATTLHRVSALCLSWFNFPADATHSPLPSRLSLSLLQFYW